MNRGVAPGTPAGALAEEKGVGHLADIEVSAGNSSALDLRVAFQAEVGVAFEEQLGVPAGGA